MYKFKLKEIEVGDTAIRRGKKSTVSAIDDKTGRIEWDIVDAADFSSVYKALSKANDFLSTLEREGKAKDDVVIDGFAEDIANLFNAFRTHVRKKYPKEYERVSRLKESVNEGHGLDQGDLDYLQFIADKNPDDTKLEKIIKFLSKSNILVDKTKDLSKGKEVNENSSEKLSIMKDENGKFIIGMAKGKYPRSKEAGPFDTQQKACEFFSEKGDIILKNLTEERLNEADINKLKIVGDIYSSCEIPVNEEEVEEGEGIGYLTPRAFGKVKNNVYTSQYGYKLVPKKIKGSGIIVKQLFEKDELKEYSNFQQKRINVFGEIEDRINNILPMLSNAKNETAEYYNENPGSYAIVVPTDYILEILDEVELKLKQVQDK